MNAHYSTSLYWSDEDEGYIALASEFPGISAFGETKEEALEEFATALACTIQTFEGSHETLPTPKKLLPYSGNIRLRVPRSLHAHLAMLAEYEGVSLNSLVMSALAGWVGAKQQETIVVKCFEKISFSLLAHYKHNANAMYKKHADTTFTALPPVTVSVLQDIETLVKDVRIIQ